MKITSVDNHGVKEFKSWFLLVCVLAAIATTVTTSGYLLSGNCRRSCSMLDCLCNRRRRNWHADKSH